jgi:hypothetical protein
MSAFINLNRATYLKAGLDPSRLNYLSAKYKNIKYRLIPKQQYVVTHVDTANAPGLAHSIYGDKSYWWILCMFNGILNPISEIAPGTVLRLPSLVDINNYLTSQDTTIVNTTVTI